MPSSASHSSCVLHLCSDLAFQTILAGGRQIKAVRFEPVTMAWCCVVCPTPCLCATFVILAFISFASASAFVTVFFSSEVSDW